MSVNASRFCFGAFIFFIFIIKLSATDAPDMFGKVDDPKQIKNSEYHLREFYKYPLEKSNLDVSITFDTETEENKVSLVSAKSSSVPKKTKYESHSYDSTAKRDEIDSEKKKVGFQITYDWE